MNSDVNLQLPKQHYFLSVSSQSIGIPYLNKFSCDDSTCPSCITKFRQALKHVTYLDSSDLILP